MAPLCHPSRHVKFSDLFSPIIGMEQTHTATPADSPTRSGTTHTSNYHSDYIGISRAALLADVPKIPEVKLESLLPAVLPDVSTNALASICEKIEKKYIEAGRWSYLKVNPEKNTGHETKIYSSIEHIFNCIISTAELSTSLVKCITSGTTTPLSQRTNTSRPDGYVQLSSKSFPVTEGDSWADIVMPMEFKKSSRGEAGNDNFAKVVWSMHHTMRNDPRRRFVFGLTVEDTKARLWFNDRCSIVSSTEFDLNKDWKVFVHIALGITRADSEELGYDPDLKLTEKTNGTSPQYDITVHSFDKSKTIYRTVGLINEVGAESLLGRGTRVWRVQKLDASRVPSGPSYALKDVWVNDDRPVEHEVIAEIIALARDPRYFLTVIDAGFGRGHSCNSSTPDHTRDVIRRGKDLETTGVVLRPAEMRQGSPTSGSKSTSISISNASKRSISVQSVPSLPQVGHWSHSNVNRFPRQHYRIVFEEIGIPLYELRSYQDITTAIEGGIKGLQAIHEAKYVHRDVSCGNILLISNANGSEKRGVIIDLEYIKKIDSESATHGVKTGTYEFMAMEVTRLEYLHFPRVVVKPGTRPAPPPIAPPFRQNELHDLESVWWIYAWTIFRLVHSDTNPTSDLLKNYNIVFESHAARYNLWQSEFSDPSTRFLDDSLRGAITYWCQALRKAYTNSYSAGDWVHVNRSCLEAVRKAQEEALEMISDATQSYPTGLSFLSELEPLQKTGEQPTGTKKRRIG